MTNDHQKKIDEMFYRIQIFEYYVKSEFYLNHYNRAEKEFERINRSTNKLSSYEKESSKTYKDFFFKYSTNASKVAEKLYNNTGVPVTVFFEKETNRFKLNQVEINADYLPCEVKFNNQPSETMLLSFDLNRGISDQLNRAKEKLKERQKKIKNITFDKISTSRKNYELITCNMRILASRDMLKSEKDLNWEQTAKKLKMSISSVQSKYKKADKMVTSGEIRLYFPPFKQ